MGYVSLVGSRGARGQGAARIGGEKMSEQKVGVVTHYFGHINVAAIALEDELRAGDQIHIVGHTSDFTETVESMQLEHEKVSVGKRGDEIAINVVEHAREHDEVFKVTA
jgi:hypothetical protein